MKKHLLLASAVAALTLSIASPAFAAPPTFTDVPAKHWSYDAVTYLAKAGIIDGYSDSTFRGDKTMTRYEMSQIVYKAMQNQNKANIAQKALIDKLAAEYALEMNKIENIDTRLTKVEKDQTVKFSGSFLDQWKEKNKTVSGVSSNLDGYAFKLNGAVKVDDQTSLNFRVTNIAPDPLAFKDRTVVFYGTSPGNTTVGGTAPNTAQVDRVWATTKIGVVNVGVGRQAVAIDPEDVIIDSGYFSYDGLRTTWTAGKLNFDLKYGRFTKGVTGAYGFSNSTGNDWGNSDVASAMVASKSGKLDWDLGAVKFRSFNGTVNGVTTPNGKNLMSYTFGNVGYRLQDKLYVGAEVGKNTEASTGGLFTTAKVVYGDQVLNAKGKSNVTLTYMKAQRNSVNMALTSLDGPSEGKQGILGGDVSNDSWKNWDYAYRYAFSKNMVGKLQYAKITDNETASESYSFYKVQMIYKF